MAAPKRILFADDDAEFLEMVTKRLTRWGYTVFTAATGNDALQAALAEKPDLVLLDVMMPYLDGYHVGSEINARMGANAPRIVLMTGRDVSREKGIGLLSGAAAILQKPLDFDELRDTLARLLDGQPPPPPARVGAA